MLRIQINICVLLTVALGLWSCAPRGVPAPVVMNGVAQSTIPAPPPPPPGQIVVKPGDTLIALARYHQAGLQALVDTNNLKAPYIIRPGQVLKMPQPGASPGSGAEAVLSLPSAQPDAPQAKATRPVSPPMDAGEDQTGSFEILDEETQTITTPTKHATTRVTTIAPGAIATRNFRWPAKGPILSEFGPKQNGLHNDGINIAAPPNAPVHAADSGVISYAGNELRGYGNLLLIRHEGGWITAYAHNSELLVKEGERVTRGQVIARAGRTGGVDQDQVHFEIRKNAKAVDPRPLLVDG